MTNGHIKKLTEFTDGGSTPPRLSRRRRRRRRVAFGLDGSFLAVYIGGFSDLVVLKKPAEREQILSKDGFLVVVIFGPLLLLHRQQHLFSFVAQSKRFAECLELVQNLSHEHLLIGQFAQALLVNVLLL